MSAVASVVQDYYFREPIKIGNWTIPLFQLPRWDPNTVLDAIRDAEEMPFAEALEMVRSGPIIAMAERFTKGIDVTKFYYEARREIDDGPYLFIRMDGEKAVVCIPPK